MSLRTPLGHARGLGSAKQGTGHWWAQRVTALALVPLTLWFAAAVICLTGAEHGTVVEWIGRPYVAVLLSVLIGIAFHHAQLGLQVVIEDYIHNEALKIGTILLVKLVSLLAAAVGIFAVLKIAFAG